MPSADSTVNAEYTECFVIEKRMCYAGYMDSEEMYGSDGTEQSKRVKKEKKNVLT